METSEKDYKKDRKIQLVRLKSLLSKIKEKDQNPIKIGALMEFKKDIIRKIPSFEINLFSKSFFRFFSKHVMFMINIILSLSNKLYRIKSLEKIYIDGSQWFKLSLESIYFFFIR